MYVKVTISLPDELEQKAREHIRTRFGNEKARAMSLIVQEALNDYLKRHDEAQKEKTQG